MKKNRHLKVIPKQRQKSEMTFAVLTRVTFVSGRNLLCVAGVVGLIVLVIQTSPSISRFKLNLNLEMSGSDKIEK